MITATVTSKGQITIPKDIRDQLKIQAGDRIHFFIDNATGTVTFLPLKTNVRELKGIVPKPQKPISISDMNEAIQAGGSKI
ncbi:MAG: AbrB/MazE/SpoVT family DNA-binding domain-containing protein [Pseudomonadota bacterium]